MSLELDPKEVLEHLHALGYCNISPELLKDFIRDLKKLIRYDQKKAALNRLREDNMPSSYRSQQEELVDRNYSCVIEEEIECEEAAKTYRKQSSNKCSQRLDCCEEDDGSEISNGASRLDSRIPESVRKENIPPRPPSSFIRPNNVGNRCKPKSDPVALYHYYQKFWTQNPRPGEDARSQLRWNIRHQMMGKQKQPQTLPRVVSEERLRSRPEWQD